jgi:carboxyl-terminal processing protease
MRLIALLLGCQWALFLRLFAAEPAQASGTNNFAADRKVGGATDALTLVSSRYTNGVPDPAKLVEGESDANIMKVVSRLLQGQHYTRKPLDDELSSKFFDRYLDHLDNLHLFFTQADVESFEKYRFKLDDLTAKGDAGPARQIFTRFRERLAQQYDYVFDLLRHEKFEFKGQERFQLDRKKLPRPSNLAEAKKLWRDRLRHEYLQEKLNKEKPEEIIKNLTRRYTRIMRTVNEYDNDDVLQIYLTALAHVYDPHSDYMGKSETDNFSISMRLSLFGIGAKLSSEDGICKINELTAGSPAMLSGKLKPGDKIIAVGQSNLPPVDVVDMKLNKVVELIRGAKDTEVRLTVVPGDAGDSSVRKIVSLIRKEIKIEDGAAKAKIFEFPDGKLSNGRDRTIRLGVIDLPSFYSSFELEGRKGGEPKSTTTDVSKLLKKLMQEGVSGVVLDLRRNGGGSLEEAINLTGLFIKEGPVVQVRQPDGKVMTDSDPDPSVFYDGPLVVLTSRFSASASEILAGALQDYGRALLVGDSSTHGKGTVQSLQQLAPIMRQFSLLGTNDPGSIKITIRKFYRASGVSTQLEGVTPDIVLPSINNLLEVGEASLDNPLKGGSIDPVPYEKVNRVEPFLADVKRRSEQRVVSDPDFVYMRSEMERYKKQLADKSVSLNEEVRLKEKKEADERAKARKKELASRPEPAGKVYDLTLKVADEPGLPPPTVRTNSAAAASNSKPILITKNGTPSVSSEKPATEPKTSPAHDSDDPDDPADPEAPDINLDETRRILVDYIHLLDKSSGVAVTRPGRPNGAVDR